MNRRYRNSYCVNLILPRKQIGDDMNKKHRRTVIRGLAISLPATWAAPIVSSVVLPAHAEISPGACGPDPNCDFNQVIDLVGTSNIQGNPVVVALPAGAYTATPIADTYTAWTKWGDTPTGCDGSGENCFHGWLNSFTVITSGGELDFGDASGSDDGFETQQQALDAAETGEFCLSEPEDVGFYLRGESVGSEGDNSGGMSIRVQCVA